MRASHLFFKNLLSKHRHGQSHEPTDRVHSFKMHFLSGYNTIGQTQQACGPSQTQHWGLSMTQKQAAVSKGLLPSGGGNAWFKKGGRSKQA